MQLRHAATVQQLHDELQLLSDQNKEQLQCKERENEQLKQHLEEQEQITAEIQQTNLSLQRPIDQLQQQLSTQNTRLSLFHALFEEIRPQPQDQSVNGKSSLSQLQQQNPGKPTKHSMILGEWKEVERAPLRMQRGAAVVDGHTAYFIGSTSTTEICCYDSGFKMWSKFPQCPHFSCSLAVIRGLLTAIGGVGYSGPQNTLFSVMNYVSNRWVELSLPMPTKRSSTAAVTTKRHLSGWWNRWIWSS